MTEQWRTAVYDGELYEGLYKVSNLGRILSLDYNHTGKPDLMKPRKRKDGYFQVKLSKNGEYKTCLVHRIVAETFLPNPEGKPCINHKIEGDEGKKINMVFFNEDGTVDEEKSTIEWVTYKENNNYATRNERISKAQKGEKNHNYGKQISEEQKKKISEAHKGKPAHNKGVPMSEEQKKKLSDSIRKSMTPDVRKKISDSKKGRQVSNETREKISESMSGEKNHNYGKPMSEETKKKLSDALKGRTGPNKGKPMSEETKKKLSDALKGRTAPNKGVPMSEEQKKKLRESAKKRKLLKQLQPDGCLPLW